MDSEQVTPGGQRTVAAEHDQAALYGAWCNSMVAAGHELFVGAQEVTSDMLAFWQSRLKEGMVTVQRFLECDSAESAMEVQLDYAKGALQAYLDQFAKIGCATTRSFAQPHYMVKVASEEITASVA